VIAHSRTGTPLLRRMVPTPSRILLLVPSSASSAATRFVPVLIKRESIIASLSHKRKHKAVDFADNKPECLGFSPLGHAAMLATNGEKASHRANYSERRLSVTLVTARAIK